MIGIYKIISPSGKIYIGQSINIESRWEKYSFLNCESQVRLYNSFKKYGWKNHKFEIIEECSIEDLNCRERYWQDFYNVLNGGLNCVLQECGVKRRIFSEETKNKLSVNNSGINNNFYNKKHSNKTKENWSKNRKGVDSKRSKLILDTQTGIFYYGAREASSAYNINVSTLKAYFQNKAPNKTNLIQI